MTHKEDNVTLASIAQRSGVSINTVAKVLAGKEKIARISENTSQRVRKISEELGYVPNQLARSLRAKHTGLVGIFVADMTDPVYADITHAVLREMPLHGLSPVITVAEAGLDNCMQMWLRNRVEAVILCGTILQMNDTFFQAVIRKSIPIIIAGNAFKQSGSLVHELVSTVHVDNDAGIKLAIDHLRSLERKQIAYISGPSWHSDDYERQEAYKKYAAAFLKPVIVSSQAESEHWQMGYNAAALVPKQFPQCDAVIAYDDLVALGALKSFADMSVKVPDDIAMVGFDDLPNSQYSIPSLTSVHQPANEIGVQTVQLLKRLLAQNSPAEHIRILPSICVRKST